MKIIAIIVRNAEQPNDDPQQYSIIFSDKANRQGLFNVKILDDTNQEIFSAFKTTANELYDEVKSIVNRLGQIVSFKEISSDDATRMIISKIKGVD